MLQFTDCSPLDCKNTSFCKGCKGNIKGIPHCTVAALMAKIIRMMVSLLSDTVAKACRSSGGRLRPWWRLAAILKIKFYHIHQ
jgi:hypothetical protein